MGSFEFECKNTLLSLSFSLSLSLSFSLSLSHTLSVYLGLSFFFLSIFLFCCVLSPSSLHLPWGHQTLVFTSNEADNTTSRIDKLKVLRKKKFANLKNSTFDDLTRSVLSSVYLTGKWVSHALETIADADAYELFLIRFFLFLFFFLLLKSIAFLNLIIIALHIPVIKKHFDSWCWHSQQKSSVKEKVHHSVFQKSSKKKEIVF